MKIIFWPAWGFILLAGRTTSVYPSDPLSPTPRKTVPTPAPIITPSLQEPTPAPRISFSLTLEEAINVALQRNIAVATAGDEVAAARLNLDAAAADYELRIVPAGEVSATGGSAESSRDAQSLGVQFSQKFYTGTRITLVPKISRRDEIYETSAAGYLTQPLLRGFSVEYNLSGILGSEYGERTSNRSLYLTQVSTIVSTVQNVYEIIRNREQLRLNEESVRRLEGYREAARVRERLGIASPIDVYRAEIELNQAVDDLNLSREAYLDAIDSLKLLLALPMDADLEITAPLDYTDLKLDEAAAIAVSLDNRVEISQAEDNVSEAERLSRTARHEILPELNLELNYKRYGEDRKLKRITDFDRDWWGVGLVAGGDIWRTAEKARFQQSLLNVGVSRRNLARLRDEIEREVKFELRRLEKLANSIEIQKEQIRQAEGKMELSRIQFSYGRASNFDLIEAERELLRAQSGLLAAVTNYIVGSYRLKAVLGTLMEKPREWHSS